MKAILTQLKKTVPENLKYNINFSIWN